MSSMPRAFVRIEGEEEVTPPAVQKTRSFDSLSVAHVLASAGLENAQENAPSGASSPSVAAAAMTLRNVQSVDVLDTAADCLMSLSSLASPNEAPAGSSIKREREEVHQSATRRRLKMRADIRPSPLSKSEAAVSEAGVPPSVRSPTPVKLVSSATPQQLGLLAAAYKLCPAPTPEQMEVIAQRVGLSADQLSFWFQSRKVLQDWLQQQPDLAAGDIRNMFYGCQATVA